MQRYQIYLKPNTVSTLADLAKELGMSRSQIIRDVVERVSDQYSKLLKALAKTRAKNNPLLKMAGFAKFGKNIAENIDEIYLKD
ncbi:CopG family transcriptional regulator [Candidatus Daviesbacteria bacterium]|nr:CopG family transcriptional regulator [Candidatus Daviesbacteria bacterium]